MDVIRVAAVEGGGTTFKVAIVQASESATGTHTSFDVLEETLIDTSSDPHATLARVVDWLQERRPFAAVGCAAFGPLDLDPSSASFGFVTSTPKPGWRMFDIRGALASAFGVPVGLDTDVNAAAMAECFVVPRPRLQVASERSTLAYITVGTGVGVGLVVNGKPVHGLLHPEGGHIYVPRHPDETIDGVCPFHGGCVEGMTCSAAAAARFGVDRLELASVADDDPRWRVHAHYLAHLCATVTLLVSPHTIVLGGGLSARACVLTCVREQLTHLLAGYVQSDRITRQTDEYIVPSALPHAGQMGAAQLALAALRGA